MMILPINEALGLDARELSSSARTMRPVGGSYPGGA
jgi:hypothetical protein